MAPEVAIAPSSAGKAQIKIGKLKTGVLVSPTANVEIAGFNAKRQPFVAVSVFSSGAITLMDQKPVFPFGKAYRIPAALPAYEEICIQDVNRAGHVVVTFDESAPDSLDNFVAEEIPYAKLYRAGKWTNLGRAYEAKINDRGDIAGITRVKASNFVGFVMANGKQKLIGSARDVLLTESGDALFYTVEMTPNQENANRIDHSLSEAIYYSKGKKTPFKIKPGLVPLALWSKDRYIAHDPNNDSVYLSENGRLTKLDRLVSGTDGLRLSTVRRIYADGSIWVDLSDNEGTAYPAFLVPAKR